MNPYRCKKQIGNATLYLGNCLELGSEIGVVDHVICDPPYEASLHSAKSQPSNLRKDQGPELKEIDFAPIDEIRSDFVKLVERLCQGWFISFCTVEGVAKWADEINASAIKYKRACVWIKPDSTPQLNGQGPAQGAECFVAGWCGKGHARWNAGGKRGVYTHCVNPPDRHGKHPTEKPWKLIAELLQDFTQPQQVIFDPFMGSGTTGVACARAGRNFVGVEINEYYFGLACERIAKAYSQQDLFLTMPAPPRAPQEALQA